MGVKRPWQSKTNWAALLVAALGFVPGVGDWISHHPELTTSILSGLMVVLRWVSNGKIELK